MLETLRTTSLDRLPNKELDLSRYSLVIADVDYTLSDFDIGHAASMRQLSPIFGDEFAKEVDKMFYLILEGHRKKVNEDWEERILYDELIKKTNELQQSFVSTFGPKVFSRETWIILAAQKLGVVLDRSQVEKGRDVYWQTLGKNSFIYPDADILLKQIQKLGLPLILMTGSDSILEVGEDLRLSYDPGFSEGYKRKRLSLLPLNYTDVVIGDPIDKPDKRFFDKLFQKVQNYGNFSKDKILVVGDSERNDLEVPRELGCATLLIKR